MTGWPSLFSAARDAAPPQRRAAAARRAGLQEPVRPWWDVQDEEDSWCGRTTTSEAGRAGRTGARRPTLHRAVPEPATVVATVPGLRDRMVAPPGVAPRGAVRARVRPAAPVPGATGPLALHATDPRGWAPAARERHGRGPGDRRAGHEGRSRTRGGATAAGRTTPPAVVHGPRTGPRAVRAPVVRLRSPPEGAARGSRGPRAPVPTAVRRIVLASPIRDVAAMAPEASGVRPGVPGGRLTRGGDARPAAEDRLRLVPVGAPYRRAGAPEAGSGVPRRGATVVQSVRPGRAVLSAAGGATGRGAR